MHEYNSRLCKSLCRSLEFEAPLVLAAREKNPTRQNAEWRRVRK